MSLFSTLESRFTFALGEDGRYALTRAHPEYPVSYSRHESFVRGPPSTPSVTVLATLSRTYDKYPIPDLREVCPGILASGQMTDNHPLVNAYVDALARIIPRHANKPSSSSASTPASAVTSLPSPDAMTLPQQPPYELTHWVAHHAGIAATLTVSNVISQQFQLFPSAAARTFANEVPKLTQTQKEAIFVLAALKVMNHPKHPAHFAFWAKNVLERTAQVVDSVLGLRPCPISSSVGWMGIQENTWALEGLQSLYIPAPVVAQKKAGGMTLRKRKAANAQTPPAEEELDKPRKRVRTTRASQKAKAEQAALAAAAAAEEQAEAEPEEEQSSSLLLSGMEALAAVSGLGGAATRDVKQEFIATTPVLQAIGLMLELPSVSSGDLPPPALSGSSSSPGHEPTASPSATRRSTRPRRKPAPPGPCSLVSTPCSAVDTPLPVATELCQAAQDKMKRNRSGSRGSSTAVSDGGYPSEEGTVVDAEIESPSKGKRKAVEMIEVGLEESGDVESGESAKASKSTARKPRPTKRAKVAEPADSEGVGENVRDVTPTLAVKKRKAPAGSSGKRKASRRA